MKNMSIVAGGLLSLALVAAPATIVVDNGMPTVKSSAAKAGPGNGNGHGPGGVGGGHGPGGVGGVGGVGGGGNANGLGISGQSFGGGNAFGQNKASNGFKNFQVEYNPEEAPLNPNNLMIGKFRAYWAQTYASRAGNMNAFRGMRAFGKAAKGSNIGKIEVFAKTTEDLNTLGPALNTQITNLQTQILAELTAEQLALFDGLTAEQIDQAIVDNSLVITDPTVAIIKELEAAKMQLEGLEMARDTAWQDAAKKDDSVEMRDTIAEQIFLGQ